MRDKWKKKRMRRLKRKRRKMRARSKGLIRIGLRFVALVRCVLFDDCCLVMARFCDSYDLKEDLGKGAFSIVKRCVHRKTGEQYAAKIINKRKLTARDLSKLEKEERVCRKLKHANIVQLHDVISEDLSHFLVFDLVTGGELFDEIVAREFYSESDASYCMQQILDSIAFCHKLHIIHRDLKPENLLLASKSKDAAVKLADFGLAVEMEHSVDKSWYGFAGTPGYLSPEVVKREPYDLAVDVWACGVIMYILLVGYPPFWDEDQKKLYSQIKLGRYDFPSPEWDSVTTDAKDLIQSMLHPNPAKRITANKALQNPWISQRTKVASTMHRQATIAGLRRFNAKRKLKGAIITTMLATRAMGSTFFATQKEDETSKSDTEQKSIQEPPSPQEGDSKTGNVDEIVKAQQSLLAAIKFRDYEAYCKLCDEQLLSFTQQGGYRLLSGLSHHKFFFENVPPYTSETITMVQPHVQFLGENSAYMCYIRLSQFVDKAGIAGSSENKDTCIWERKNGKWQCVHMHTS